MLKILACLLTILALSLPGQAALLKGDQTTIAISGKGIVKAMADVAYVGAGVERSEKTATEAQQKAAQKMNNIIASLTKMGIPKDKIETTRVSLHPKYEYEGRKRVFVGYTARNQIKITVDKLDDLGKIVDAAIAAGATNVDNISFSIKDEAVYKKAALQKAFNDAQGKAEIIAAAAGQVLEKIVKIQEAEVRVSPIVGMRALAAEGVGEAAETPVLPGKVEVRGSLTVIYECSAKK
jgi:uncharacterized protein YggE